MESGMDSVPCRELELVRDFVDMPLYWKGTYVPLETTHRGRVGLGPGEVDTAASLSVSSGLGSQCRASSLRLFCPRRRSLRRQVM